MVRASTLFCSLAAALALLAPRAEAAETITVNAGESINDAIDMAEPGDTIRVKSGVYRPNEDEGDGGPGIVVDVPGITLMGQNAVIDGEYQGFGMLISAPGVTVRGFTFVNCSDGLVVDFNDDEDGKPDLFGETVITRNRFSANSNNGINVRLAGAVRIERNIIEDSGQSGIVVQRENIETDGLPSDSETLILGNRSEFNGEDGIEFEGSRATITGNTCTHNADDGLNVDITPVTNDDGEEESDPLITIARNRIHYNTDDGIDIDGDPNVPTVIERNRITLNGEDGLSLDYYEDFDDGPADGIKAFPRHLIARNTFSNNNEDGCTIEIDDGGESGSVLIERNNAHHNGEGGISLREITGGNDSARVENNRAHHNGYFGIELGSPDIDFPLLEGGKKKEPLDGAGSGDGGPDSGTYRSATRNTCSFNGLGGILSLAQSARIVGNRCDRNLGDGITIAFSSFNFVNDNRCSRNSSQGIDNWNATIEELIGNRTGNNALGVGVDIAGGGPNGSGVVNNEDDNTGTGGGDATGEPDMFNVIQD